MTKAGTARVSVISRGECKCIKKLEYPMLTLGESYYYRYCMDTNSKKFYQIIISDEVAPLKIDKTTFLGCFQAFE